MGRGLSFTEGRTQPAAAGSDRPLEACARVGKIALAMTMIASLADGCR
jgi:hypothetical protein